MSSVVQQRPLAGINLAIHLGAMNVEPSAAGELQAREREVFLDRHCQGIWGPISLFQQENNQRLAKEMHSGGGSGSLISAHTGSYGKSFRIVSQVENGRVTCTTLQLAPENLQVSVFPVDRGENLRSGPGKFSLVSFPEWKDVRSSRSADFDQLVFLVQARIDSQNLCQWPAYSKALSILLCLLFETQSESKQVAEIRPKVKAFPVPKYYDVDRGIKRGIESGLIECNPSAVYQRMKSTVTLTAKGRKFVESCLKVR